MTDKGEDWVINPEWKEEIKQAFANNKTIEELFMDDNFLHTIYECSMYAFDSFREVQVVIDAKEKLFITHGTGGFVWFGDGEEEGMQLPIKCWIHTHPNMTAYFSGTDWNTIRTWKPMMQSAIVLGGDERQTNQRMMWTKGEQHTIFFKRGHNMDNETPTSWKTMESEKV
tara:strand:+ start:493 stop:1002 length:510 start_codon:yes stop_codon:yes gene_type:complete